MSVYFVKYDLRKMMDVRKDRPCITGIVNKIQNFLCVCEFWKAIFSTQNFSSPAKYYGMY